MVAGPRSLRRPRVVGRAYRPSPRTPPGAPDHDPGPGLLCGTYRVHREGAPRRALDDLGASRRRVRRHHDLGLRRRVSAEKIGRAGLAPGAGPGQRISSRRPAGDEVMAYAVRIE